MDKTVDLTELVFLKFQELKASRNNPYLKRHPIDSLNFSNSEELHKEIVLINQHKSTLSRNQRDTIQAIMQNVVLDLIKQSESQPDEGTESGSEN